MVNFDEKLNLYQCPVCKFFYKTKEKASLCEAWCSEHNSCNLEIIKDAVKPETEKQD